MRAVSPRTARDAQEQLGRAGFDTVALPGIYRPAPDGEDITILPLATNAPGDAARPPPGSHKPLATLASCGASCPPALGLSASSAFDGAIALDAPPALLKAQLDCWIDVAIAEEERVRRLATATACGLSAPQSFEARHLKVLHIGAPSATFLALDHAMAEHGGAIGAAFTSHTGVDHLHDEVFDAVVLNASKDANTALSLCSAFRRNASLFHLPTMVVTAPGDIATTAAAIERGAAAVAEANAPCGSSLAWLFEAIRRERRRRAAEHDLRGLADVMGDTRTGLWRRPTFHAHLTRLAADHHTSGRSLSLAVLRVMPAHGARCPSEEVWRRGCGEIASLAARLVRASDLGAALGDELIAIAFPASELFDAMRAAGRIAAVAECTAFVANEGGAGPLVVEQSTVELQPGESGEGMLARALRAIELETIPA